MKKPNEPIVGREDESQTSIFLRRKQYLEKHAQEEPDDTPDFEPAARAEDTPRFELDALDLS